MGTRKFVSRELLAKDVNLSSIYPISWVVGFRRTWIVLTFAIVASLGATVLAALTLPGIEDGELKTLSIAAAKGLVVGLWAAWGLRFIYEQLARLSCYYGIEDGHFVIARGIFIRERGSFPLARITDVYLESNLMNLFFGVRTLHLATPTMLSEQFARIDGLPTRVAEALQRRISRLVERGIAKEGSSRDEQERLITTSKNRDQKLAANALSKRTFSKRVSRVTEARVAL